MSTAPRPQPVATAGAISSVVTILAVIAGAFGIVLSDGQRDQLSAGILGLVGLVSLVGQVIAFLKARNAVTPVSDPVDARGIPLVPADSYEGIEIAEVYPGDQKTAAALHYTEGGPDDLDDDEADDEPTP